MEIHDLLVLLQHEVQKSLSFIDETRGVNPEIPAIHISLESVEIELPIVMSEVDLIWDPQQLKGTPNSVKRLKMPYHSRSCRYTRTNTQKTSSGKGY